MSKTTCPVCQQQLMIEAAIIDKRTCMNCGYTEINGQQVFFDIEDDITNPFSKLF